MSPTRAAEMDLVHQSMQAIFMCVAVGLASGEFLERAYITTRLHWDLRIWLAKIRSSYWWAKSVSAARVDPFPCNVIHLYSEPVFYLAQPRGPQNKWQWAQPPSPTKISWTPSTKASLHSKLLMRSSQEKLWLRRPDWDKSLHLIYQCFMWLTHGHGGDILLSLSFILWPACQPRGLAELWLS